MFIPMGIIVFIVIVGLAFAWEHDRKSDREYDEKPYHPEDYPY